MNRTVKVPAAFSGPFAVAEGQVGAFFDRLTRAPEEGCVRIDGERYVLMRCASLYVAWFDALEDSFGAETARAFIYNTARELGRSDATAFATRLSLEDPVAKLSAGPVHFAHAGWARVELHDDCVAEQGPGYFLHYNHPNTFEAEVLQQQRRTPEAPACVFSAGYSAGWCTAAFETEVQAREIRCRARGDEHCEFVMAPAEQLERHCKRHAPKP